MAEVFISYSRKDERYREELEIHLKGLNFQGQDPIDWWSDARLEPGSLWKDELLNALRTCRIALLLVSKDFLASDFIALEELPAIFARIDKQDGLKIFWVLLSPCAWEYTPIAQYSAISDLSRPLSSMRSDNRNKFWSKELIPKILEELRQPSQSGQSTDTIPRLFKEISDHFGLIEKNFVLNIPRLLDWFDHYKTSSPIVDPRCITSLQKLAKDIYQKNTVELSWNAPEPHQIKLFSKNTIKKETRAKKAQTWSDFELITSRFYPRFRDAHLALLLHERVSKSQISKVDFDDDRYHCKRILRGILRKQKEYNQVLQKLESLSPDQKELGEFRSHHSYLLLCHIALLWAVETQIFSSTVASSEQSHWLFLSTRLCERICHWLLQAHSVARHILEVHDKDSHRSATSPLIRSGS